MAVGDIERLVEGLVNRGIVSPKMVGRTVGQATIDELQNLGRSVNESQTRLQREQADRVSMVKSQVAKQAQRIGFAQPNGYGRIKDPTKPFVAGHTAGSLTMPSELTIATPTSKGLQLKSTGYMPAGLSGQSPKDLDALMRMALENSGINAQDAYGVQNAIGANKIPKIGTSYMAGRDFGSIEEIMNEIARQTTDVGAFKNLFGG
jgi:hypothetical protein